MLSIAKRTDDVTLLLTTPMMINGAWMIGLGMLLFGVGHIIELLKRIAERPR